MKVWIFFVVLSVATAASADIRAVFKNTENGREISFELNDSGALRVSTQFSSYYLFRGERSYLVEAGPELRGCGFSQPLVLGQQCKRGTDGRG